MFTIGWFKLKESTDLHIDETVSVSIIIPFRNEETNLPALIQCLSKQHYPVTLLEIILVDDHSEDSGYKLIHNLISDKNLTNFTLLSLTDKEGISKKAALKKGIEYSRGELIITTDADCTMGENWVSSIAARYLSDKRPMISGPVCIVPGKSFFSKLQSLEFFSLMGAGAGAIGINRPFLANGANLAFTRKLYIELNGYTDHINYTSGDDVFMILKAKQKHHISFLKNEDAIVYTKASPNLRTFFFQRIRWASKSSGYNDKVALITAFTIFLYSSLIVILFGLGIFNLQFLFFAVGLYFIKLLADFILINNVSRFFHLHKLMWYYLPMQFFYTIYIMLTAFLSLLIPFEWKNRKSRK